MDDHHHHHHHHPIGGRNIIYFHILGIIIPTDFHIFRKGPNHQPVIIIIIIIIVILLILTSILPLLLISIHIHRFGVVQHPLDILETISPQQIAIESLLYQVERWCPPSDMMVGLCLLVYVTLMFIV